VKTNKILRRMILALRSRKYLRGNWNLCRRREYL